MGHPEWSCGRIFEDFGINFWWIFWVKGWLERKNVTERPLRIGIQAVFSLHGDPRASSTFYRIYNQIKEFSFEFLWFFLVEWLQLALEEQNSSCFKSPWRSWCLFNIEEFSKKFFGSKILKKPSWCPPQSTSRTWFYQKQFYWCILLVLYWD